MSLSVSDHLTQLDNLKKLSDDAQAHESRLRTEIEDLTKLITTYQTDLAAIQSQLSLGERKQQFGMITSEEFLKMRREAKEIETKIVELGDARAFAINDLALAEGESSSLIKRRFRTIELLAIDQLVDAVADLIDKAKPEIDKIVNFLMVKDHSEHGNNQNGRRDRIYLSFADIIYRAAYENDPRNFPELAAARQVVLNEARSMEAKTA